MPVNRHPMRINHNDGQYALELWEDADSTSLPDQCEYSDNIETLRERAKVLLSAGRFKWIGLCRWDADTERWIDLEALHK